MSRGLARGDEGGAAPLLLRVQRVQYQYLRRQVGVEAVGDQHGHGGVRQLRAHRQLEAVVLCLQVGHLEKGEAREPRGRVKKK